MSRYFEPVDYASLQVRTAELEDSVLQKDGLCRSLLAENSGLLMALCDAIDLILNTASASGSSSEEAEALPVVQLLRAAVNIPATEDMLETLVSKWRGTNQNHLKEIAA